MASGKWSPRGLFLDRIRKGNVLSLAVSKAFMSSLLEDSSRRREDIIFTND